MRIFIRTLSLSWLLLTSPLSWANQNNIFDKGVALGVYSSLEWISQPIPVNFTNPQFHESVFKIRKSQLQKVMSAIDELRSQMTDRDLIQELDSSIASLQMDIAELESENYPWGVKALLLNEAAEKTRERQLRFLVNTYEDMNPNEANQLAYELQAEDLYGFYFGLQILGHSQNLKIFELSDPFHFTFFDVWYLAESFKAIRQVLLRRLVGLDPALIRSSALGLETIAVALNNPHLQQLYSVISQIEGQWCVGNNKSLRFKEDSPEYKSILSQIKSMLKTAQNLSDLLDEQLQVQRRNVQLSIKSCVDLLSQQ